MAATADVAQLSHLLECQTTPAALPPSPLRTHADRIEVLIGHDALADVASRLAALAEDADPWLAQAGAAFIKGSPTSAALAYTLLQRARHLSLAEVFRLEYQASVGCCVHHDFAEGVRALLVDKDKQPRWAPEALSDVSTDLIEAHLVPRFEGPHPLVDLH